MKFAHKLSLSVTAVAFVIVPLLGFAISRAVRHMAVAAIVSQQTAIAYHLSGDIEQVLASAGTDIQMISEDVFLSRFLLPSSERFTNQDRGDMSQELKARSRMTGPWYGVMAIGRDGMILLSTLKDSVGRNIREFAAGRQTFQAVLQGERYRSDVLPFDSGGRPTVVLAIPITSEDRAHIIGAVVGYFDWTAILRVLDQANPRSLVYLANHDGLVLATLSREQDRILRYRLPRSGLLDTARAGKVASGTVTLEQGSDPQFATAITVDAQSSGNPGGWTLLLATPRSVVFAPVDEMTQHIVGGVTAAMLVMAMLFYAMGRRLARPVEHLTAAIADVSAGKLENRARIETGDEVGTLAAAFNGMVDELRRQREELSTVKTFLESIVNTSAGVIFALDPDGRWEFVNERGLALVGYRREELLQQSFLALISSDARDTIMAEFEAVLGGATLYTREATVLRKDGAEIWIEYSAAPLTKDGKVVRIVGTAADITERKQAALAIEISERKLRAVLDATTEGIVMVDAQTRKVILPNLAFCDMLGYNLEETAMLGVDDIHPAESLPYVIQQFERQARGEIKIATDMPVLRKDGSVFFADISTSATLLDGRMCMVGAFHDITERKQVEEALRKSEEKFRSLVESSNDMVWEVDQNGVYTYISPRILDLLGYASEEILGKTPFDLMPPEEASRVAGEFARLVAERQPIRSLENTNRHNNGRLVVLETNGVPFFLPDGSLGGYRGIDRDITERIQARRELEFKNTLLATQQEASPDGILVIDTQARIVHYNQRFVELWDIPRELVEAGDDEPVLKLVVSRQDDPAAFLARVKYLYEHRQENSQEELALHDGRTVDRYSAPMFGADGTYYGRVWYFRDITARKRAEEALRHRVDMEKQIAEISTRFLSLGAEDIDSGIRLALESIGRFSAADRSYIFQFTDGETKMTNTHEWCAAGIPSSIQSLQNILLESMPWFWDHMVQRCIFHIPCVADLPAQAQAERRMLEAQHVQSLVVVPMVLKGTLLGFLGFETMNTPRTWSDEDINLLSVVGDLIANALERVRAEQQVWASLAEKEALLREIHHRVKNNMQVVISLLNLEASKIADPAVVQMLRDGQRRIEVMALVHEKLHQSRELAQVDAKSYVEDLARNTFHAHERGSAKVQLVLDVEPVGLGLDAATPCGLIVNELISNALKHAFPGDGAGEIRVALHAADDGDIELAVSDDGIGMPAEFDWRGAQTLGLRLVRNLVERQLQGQLELDRTHGTVWRIRFGS